MLTIRNHSFEYYDHDLVKFEYHTEYDCEENGCDQICRCGRIEDAHVTKVDLNNLIKRYSKDGVEGIDLYGIDRILRLQKVYDIENWKVKVSAGYYGDEIDGVFVEDSVASKVDEQFSAIFFCPDDDAKVEELLKMEYGYLLDGLENRKWTVEEIDKSQLIFGQGEHYKKLDPVAVANYKDYDGIRGVVIPKGDKFRLIDGYHRCAAGGEKLKVLVGRNEDSSKVS